MFSIIWRLLRKGFKFTLIIAIIMFIIANFWEWIKAFIYHINLSMYFFFWTYIWNDVIYLLTLIIVIMLVLFIYKIIKRVI